ncbi:hypothetical protein G7Y89_g1538 [Cudoniella acicularis]|uniref:Cupin type-2 domain-containing protein n=1 Tax=Cudoniella acicularis TaxID=354080 RepID=A0A8H4RVW0_9HELO|nr:hypothetical protein G7Y89_g1538 [Cudoniella acicularis]
MAPCKPRTFTAGEDPLTKFDGAISMGNLPCPPGRQFLFHGFLRPHLGIYKKLIANGQKPPTHFHPTQWEFFRVVKGHLTVDLNGVPKNITSKDGEIVVPPYTHHVMYGTPGTENNEVEFEVSATESENPTDQAFFENWYGYQEDVFQRGEKLDLIQILAMFDAGATYLSPPWWVPFRCFLSLWFHIIVGRWIGALLGYAPYYPEWTTDWDAACDQMEKSWFQRKFAVRDAQVKARARWEKQKGSGKAL